ncbi:MAG: hypothetical protein GF331_05170 [Chitinivibrionales bacterium]|nr:hypothetical protein [Chitinivibrionales bacterium]
MSLTIARSSIVRRALLTAATAACLSSASAEPLTSSDIHELAGSGDTLWLVTSSGLNFALDTTDATPQWWAHETGRTAWGLAFGGGQALVCTDASADVDVSRQWAAVYDHSSDTLESFELTWRHERYRDFAGAEELQPSYECYGAVRSAGAWWMACLDGGLVRWDGTAATVAAPGIADTMHPIIDYPPSSLDGRFTEGDARPVGVDVLADSAGAQLIVSTPERVWRFDESSVSWDSLSAVLDDDRLTLLEFGGVWVNRKSSPAGVFVKTWVRKGQDTTAYLFRYAGDRWVEVFGSGTREGQPLGVSFAHGRYMYVAHRAGIHLFDVSNPSAPSEIGSRGLFQQRMERAPGDVAWDVMAINDVLACEQPDSTVTLWIATSEGLFYARDERPADASDAPFGFTKRPLVIDNGVDNIRAYPTILNEEAPNGRVKFAYRLTEKARVTIRIYDWNMDLVRTAVDGVREPAAEGQTSARAGEDYWDGRNEAGRIVAPGVYYYRITTDKGGRAFGKIIVALKR